MLLIKSQDQDIYRAYSALWLYYIFFRHVGSIIFILSTLFDGIENADEKTILGIVHKGF